LNLNKETDSLHTLIRISLVCGQLPEIVFEATGVYSQGLEKFLQEHQYPYSRLSIHLRQNSRPPPCVEKKDIGDAHEQAKSHFRVDRSETYIQEDYYD